jgi:hypothetical protein
MVVFLRWSVIKTTALIGSPYLVGVPTLFIGISTVKGASFFDSFIVAPLAERRSPFGGNIVRWKSVR